MTGRRQHDHVATIRAAVDVLLYAPLGFGAMLIEDAPKAVEQARQELNNARFIGRFTVDQGVAELRGRLDAAAPAVVDDRPLPTLDPAIDASAAMVSPAVGGTPPETDPASLEESGEPVPMPGDLALPDYETLPAIDIVAKLDTLGPEERSAIERYESANRQRRTVLGKLAQLAQLAAE